MSYRSHQHSSPFNLRHTWLIGLTLSSALTGVLLLIYELTGVRTALAQEQKQAHIIVQFDDQARVARAVTFTTSISGLRALQLSQLAVITVSTSFGPAVCSIEGVGCPATNCFCDPNRFWGYSYWDGNTWQSYSVGATSSIISQTGAIEGWRWGEFGAAQTVPTPTLAALAGLTWLQTRQSITNGGYASVAATGETLLAAGANHLPAQVWRRTPASPSAQEFIAASGPTFSQANAAAAGKVQTALAATASCLPLASLTPNAHYSPTLGAYSKQSGYNTWAILGATAISESVPVSAVNYLRSHSLPGGGWEWSPGWGADTNTTALALQALIAAGEPISSAAVISGLGFLKSTQKSDGGFPYDADAKSNSDTNSTAYVVQAIIAAGEEPDGVRWSISNTTPISYLLAMQLPDGSFEWQPNSGANALATQQAIPALLGQIHPVQRQPLVACSGLLLPLVQR